MTNRYGHLIDTTRSLSRKIKEPGNDSAGQLHAQLRIMYLRARVLRRAIFFATLSLLLAALLVSVLFLPCLLHWEAASVIVIMFIGCMIALCVSLIAFLTDINMSLNALSLEMDSHNDKDDKTIV